MTIHLTNDQNNAANRLANFLAVDVDWHINDIDDYTDNEFTTLAESLTAPYLGFPNDWSEQEGYHHAIRAAMIKHLIYLAGDNFVHTYSNGSLMLRYAQEFCMRLVHC